MAFKRVGILIMWLVVFVFALCLIATFSPFAFLYNLIRLFYKKKVGNGLDALNSDLRKVNYTLDLLGNVTLFSWIDHKKDRHEYGNYNETISIVLHKREKANQMTWFDKTVYWFITLFDRKHFKNLD